MTGYQSKKAAAQDKVTDIDGHVVRDVRKPKKAAALEQNFCPRCGKRTKDIHTCTPPQENT